MCVPAAATDIIRVGDECNYVLHHDVPARPPSAICDVTAEERVRRNTNTHTRTSLYYTCMHTGSPSLGVVIYYATVRRVRVPSSLSSSPSSSFRRRLVVRAASRAPREWNARVFVARRTFRAEVPIRPHSYIRRALSAITLQTMQLQRRAAVGCGPCPAVAAAHDRQAVRKHLRRWSHNMVLIIGK